MPISSARRAALPLSMNFITRPSIPFPVYKTLAGPLACEALEILEAFVFSCVAGTSWILVEGASHSCLPLVGCGGELKEISIALRITGDPSALVEFDIGKPERMGVEKA